ncbi:Plasma membrane sulfite pump involved in sulfite metabolism [Coemansia sp. RSA 1722]|nr:Plasma membrane sulfite pump involved in sulfite metabolism [Coemansia sp. RSA 486]KAJ2224211.1 Plasma membrane sulfite pump involved in sulfite metabolism [Coemansia sp. RSA 485]KAJ2589688.1 Plasma membrane sulfite pump involved in sulfite metabolism [Coemansia sp. RSA 1722]
MPSNGSTQRRLMRTLAILGQAKADWLALSIAPSSFSQLYRAYILTSETLNDKNPYTLLDASTESWQIQAIAIISYTGLAMLLLVLSIFLLHLILGIFLPAPQTRHQQVADDTPVDLFSLVQYTYLVPLALLASVANFCGLVDITAMPLLADVFLGIWRICACFGAIASITALPIYLMVKMRCSQLGMQQQHKQAPWFLLYIPGIVAATTASELAAILPNKRASEVLFSGYLLWGSSVIPALAFAIVFVRARLSLTRQPNVYHLILPLSLMSQTALSIMALGIQSQRVWTDTSGPATAPLLLGEIAMASGAILGMVFWAAAAAWFVNSHLVVVLKTTSPRNLLVALRLLITTRIVAFPVASFAIATAALARIWHSTMALALTKVLLVYVGCILSGIYVAMIWNVCSFAYGLVVSRKQRLALEPPGLYGQTDDSRPCLPQQQQQQHAGDSAASGLQSYGSI